MLVNKIETSRVGLSTNHRNNCPDFEILAGLMGGELSMDIREQTIAHLRICTSCKDLFGESLEIISDLPEDARAVPTPLEWRNKNRSPFTKISRIFAIILPAAAAATFLFFAPFHHKDWSAETMLDGVVASTNFQLSTNTPLSDYRENILGFSEGISKNKLFFKAGILVTKLEIALQLKNSQQSFQIAQSLQSLLSNSQLKTDLFIELVNPRKETKLDLDLTKLERQIRILEKDVDQSSNRFFFHLGLSTEAGKVAAFAHSEAFFQQHYFKDLLEREKMNQLPPGTIRKLQSIRKLVTNQKLSENYNSLYQNFEEIQKGLL